MIELDVVEDKLEKAEPIMLSAKFDDSPIEPYKYQLPDKLKVDDKPPSAIKITRLPKKGTMKTKAHGKDKVLQVGDIVPAGDMDSFVYDQPTDECTTDKLQNCEDTFSFVPLSSW